MTPTQRAGWDFAQRMSDESRRRKTAGRIVRHRWPKMLRWGLRWWSA